MLDKNIFNIPSKLIRYFLNEFQNNPMFVDYAKIKNIERIMTPTYIYLMKDTSNNAIKIGISKQPKYREKTLISDKSTIICIYSELMKSLNVAKLTEKQLHKEFKSKRLRGEWFNLNDDDIERCKSYIDYQKHILYYESIDKLNKE